MSSPKEKAKELVEKFYPRATSYASDRKNQIENAKQCALIVVDEIITVCPYFSKDNCDTIEQIKANDIEFVSYWEQVKKEIENL